MVDVYDFYSRERLDSDAVARLQPRPDTIVAARIVPEATPCPAIDAAFLKSPEAQMTESDMHFLCSTPIDMERVHERIRVITTFVFITMHFSEASPIVVAEQEKMHSESLGQLCEVALNTGQAHWFSTPGYFAALVREFNERMHRIAAEFDVSI